MPGPLDPLTVGEPPLDLILKGTGSAVGFLGAAIEGAVCHWLVRHLSLNAGKQDGP